MTQQASRTNASNRQYDLVSVLYHSLKGAQTYDAYKLDAQQEGDQELSAFFQQLQQEDMARADKARQLLGSRMSS